MFVSDVNDVKIYNLSAGKSLPDVSSKKFNNLKFLTFYFVSSVAHGPQKKISFEQKCRSFKKNRAHSGF